MEALKVLLLIPIACVVVPLAVVIGALRLVGAGATMLWTTARALVGTPELPPSSTRLTVDQLSSTAPIVCFVHGTFASGAPWTASDGRLAKAIATRVTDRLGTAPIFQRIEWSGANTVAARGAAIADLEQHLARIFDSNPHRRVCVIGHSHGGNVALTAAQRFGAHEGLSVVTLATPFIIAQVRRDAAVIGLLLRLLMLLSVVVPCSVAVVLLPGLWKVAPVAIALVALAVLIPAIVRQATTRDSSADALLSSVPDLATLETLVPRTLIVSRTGDEADGLLKLASFVNGWIAHTLRGSQPLEELSRMLALALDVVDRTTSSSTRAGMRMARPGVRDALAFVGAQFRLSRQWPEIAGALAGFALLALLRVAFGTSSGLLATTTVVTSSETPPGQWQHVQTLASSHPTDTVVSHSQIYGDDAVCALVAAWVEPQLIGRAE
jgi:hypothetical protein